MEPKTKRTVAVSVGSACFSTAFFAPSALLPFAQMTPMLAVVGVAAPTGVGFAVWSWINYVAARHDVRMVRTAEPEPQMREDLVG